MDKKNPKIMEAVFTIHIDIDHKPLFLVNAMSCLEVLCNLAFFALVIVIILKVISLLLTMRRFLGVFKQPFRD